MQLNDMTTTPLTYIFRITYIYVQLGKKSHSTHTDFSAYKMATDLSKLKMLKISNHKNKKLAYFEI